MKNMCLDQLYLVGPKHFPHPDAHARASGADDVLDKTIVCDTLDEAIADCALIFGTTARQRSLSWPEVTPRGCSEKASEVAVQQPVAIVFGREDSGLSNDELERCQYMVRIPSNSEYSSLNIAAAVQIIAYELHMRAFSSHQEVVYTPKDRLVTGQQLEGYFLHLQKVMEKIGFIDVGEPRNVIRRLRRLYGRVGLGENEMNILRGMLTATEKALDKNA